MFDAETSGFDDVQNNLTETGDAVIASAEHGTRAYAEFLLQRIKQTAPTESGEYRADWRIEERHVKGEKRLVIVNSTDHGPYLVFPNQKMIGSPKADDPARGIIHNVRGIVKSTEAEFQKSVLEQILDILR